jgi:hypothetical protein
MSELIGKQVTRVAATANRSFVAWRLTKPGTIKPRQRRWICP